MPVPADQRVLRAPTTAPVRDASTAHAPEQTPARAAFHSVEIQATVAETSELWNALRANALSTPYQSPGLLGPWQTHVADNEGFETAVVVARDEAGRPVALLPLGVRVRLGVRVARFMGGSHTNYNLMVIRLDALDAFTPDECRRLLTEAARALRLDCYALRNQPYAWEGVQNPFAGLPRQPSPDSGYRGPLAPTLDDHLKLFMSSKARSNQRRKMRRFEERGTPRIYRADLPHERARLLDAYLTQKGEQFAARGIPNVFERPGVRNFLADAAAIDGGAPTIDLYGFDLDDEVIAVTGGVSDGARYCGMFISITGSEHSKYSPGEMLMNFVVEDAIRRGIRTFDLGVGAAPYKRVYCPTEEPLFDSIFGVTAKGRSAAAAFSALTGAKVKIKSTPWAYGLIQRVRRWKAQREDEPLAGGADEA